MSLPRSLLLSLLVAVQLLWLTAGQIAPCGSGSTVYNCTARTAPAPVTFTPSTPSLALSDDAVDVGVPIGFTFTFYGVSYDRVNIGPNGDIQFQTTSSSYSPSAFGVGNADLVPFIAFFYTDLYPISDGTRQYGVIGTAPRRTFVLRYSNVPYCCDSTNPGLTADVLLYETTNQIELRYYSVVADDSHSVDIGIENSADSTGGYDFIAIANYVSDDTTFNASLVNAAYTFTPIVPFTNPTRFVVAPPTPDSSASAVYTATGPTTAPAQTALTASTVLPYDDDGVTAVPIGFTFTFYNVSYTSAYVGTNGNIQFQTSSSDQYPDTLDSTYNDAAPFIAFFFTDLQALGSPSVRSYGVTGTAGARRFILRYTNVYVNYAGVFTPPLNCDVVLYETSNNIELRYYSVPWLDTYSYVDIGVQNAASADFTTDYVAIINQQTVTPAQAFGFVNVSYTIRPTTAFVNPSTFTLRPPQPTTTTSTVYTAAYAVAPAPVAFTTAGTLPYTSDEATPVNLPFNFTFYNVSYTQIAVGANGNIQFQTASTNSYPDILGGLYNSNPSPMIAFFYVDLDPSAAPASRTYGVVGVAPTRQFVVRYVNVPAPSYVGSGVLTCDVILYEGSNNVELRYYQVPSTGQYYYVDIGIQNTLSGTNTYDYVAVVNYQAISIAASTLVNASYTFRPIVPFTGSPAFGSPSTTSAVYSGTRSAVPAPVQFTQMGSLNNGDDVMTYVLFGFTFVFYNYSYVGADVSSNGNIQFQTGSTSGYPAAFGDVSLAALSPVIAFFWADLVPSATSTMTYGVTGTAPNRAFVLRFANVATQSYISTGTLSVDVLLYETTNKIEMRYYQVPTFYQYYYVDIGLQNSVVNSAYDSIYVANYQPMANPLLSVVNNTSFTFTPKVPFTSAPLFAFTPVPSISSTVYSVATSNAPAAVAMPGSTQLPLEDNGVEAVPIGFTFTFYGVSYTSVYAGSNGDVQFQTAYDDYAPGSFGSGVVALAPLIAGFFTDINPSSSYGYRSYATIGTAPNRQLVLRYNNVSMQTTIPSSGTLSMDIVLTETTNAVELRYYSVPTFTSSYYYVDIGIENVYTTTYDWIAIINQQTPTAFTALGLTGKRYVFTPTTPFVNPTVFNPVTPLDIASVSAVYRVVNQTRPALVSLPNTVSLPLVDNDVTAAPMGFGFVFYGVNYTTAYIAANGNIQFATAATTQYPGTFQSTSNSALSPFIAFYFSDLLPAFSTTGRVYATIGTAPNRQFVVRYTAVPFFYLSSVAAVTCDVLLTETTNTIELRYYAVSPVPFSTGGEVVDIGISSGTGTDYISLVNDLALTPTRALSLAGTSFLFSPILPFATSGLAPFRPPTVTVRGSSRLYTGTVRSSVVAAPDFTAVASPALTLCDDCVDTGIPFGFAFVFGGVSYTSAAVSSNGNIQFSSSPSSSLSPALFPTGTASFSPLIAFFWADLYPMAAGSRSYGTIGSAPNRQFILRWKYVMYCCDLTPYNGLTVDVVLSETTNTVELRYYNAPAGYNSIDIGIQVSTTDYLYVRNRAALDGLNATVLTGSTVVFAPISAPTSSSSSSAAPVVVTAVSSSAAVARSSSSSTAAAVSSSAASFVTSSSSSSAVVARSSSSSSAPSFVTSSSSSPAVAGAVTSSFSSSSSPRGIDSLALSSSSSSSSGGAVLGGDGSSDSGSSGLSGGAIAGIVIGSVVGGLLLLLCVFCALTGFATGKKGGDSKQQDSINATGDREASSAEPSRMSQVGLHGSEASEGHEVELV